MTRTVWTSVAVLAAVAAVAVSCDATENGASTTGSGAHPPTPTSSSATTTTTDPGPASPTTTTATTTDPDRETTIPATAPSTVHPHSTNTTLPGPTCDAAEATRLLDDTLAVARLSLGGTWTDDTDDIAFDARTDSAEVWAGQQGFDCGLRLAQRTDDAERLALVAWNDRRHALVVQATDAPAEPYATEAVFQLLIEQPYGEFLIDQEVWAATMAGGESIVLGVRDTSIGLAAKSWQAAVPPFEDLPVNLDAERYGIDVLRAAGARNVSVAEPAPHGWEIGSLQLHTPWALPAFAGLGAADTFDPMVPIVADGITTFHDIADVEVRLTTGDELPGIVLHEAGWRCDDHSWRLMSGNGTPAEILEFATWIIETTCT